MHVLRGLGRAARTIAALPWPALLVAALLFALVLTVVPLALFIFIVFMAVKLAVAAIVVDRRRNRRD
ncbi:hypothetical protein E4O92_09590 [Massilia horti]|uniref:Uncharacterized protein n=2 Tax=Massilia horti TaxID=2562153 RepID=A0A4Y9T0D4_9BURK|nr:hypothetical protein E4O92_09590 [Massilia horti]